MNRRRGIIIGICLLAVIGMAGCVPWAFSEWQEAQVEAAMHNGGYVLYLRHADRYAGAKESLSANSTLSDFSRCDGQRNLTDEGRGDAAQIGHTLESLGIPVGAVIALPLCRTRDTAILAFGRAELDPRLYDPDFVAKLLATAPRAGTNTVLVDTKDPARRLAGVTLLPAEAAVFKPRPGGYDYIGHLDQDDLDP
jgi:phosphohistidine phosphatase SixA